MMKPSTMPRARAAVAAVAVAAVAVTSLAAVAVAQTWPSKVIRVIVPFSAGSATDIVPRAVFEQVSQQVGQTIIVENRTGGGTTIGTLAVAKSDPDGHTILVHSNAFVTTPAIQSNAPYDPVADFSALMPLGNVPLVLVISPDKNIRTLKDLVAAAKANPGKINYAAAGIGTPPHLTAVRFLIAAGVEAQLVPFRGAPEALTEVLAGRVDFYFCPITPAMPHIRDGRLLALAVSSSKRAAALPDVLTTVEAGYANSEFDFWIGAFVPKKTPREVVAKMHQETVKAIESATVKERLTKLGVEPLIMKPEEFDTRVASETRIALELARVAGIAAK